MLQERQLSPGDLPAIKANLEKIARERKDYPPSSMISYLQKDLQLAYVENQHIKKMKEKTSSKFAVLNSNKSNKISWGFILVTSKQKTKFRQMLRQNWSKVQKLIEEINQCNAKIQKKGEGNLASLITEQDFNSGVFPWQISSSLGK